MVPGSVSIGEGSLKYSEKMVGYYHAICVTMATWAGLVTVSHNQFILLHAWKESYKQ